MLEWRKGYPSEEMIAAHQSRWWLRKRKDNETIDLSAENLSPTLVGSIEWSYYFSKYGMTQSFVSGDDKIILCKTIEDWSETYDVMYEKYRFCLDKDGSINIYGKFSTGDDDPSFEGKLEGVSVKQIKSDEDADYLWHAEIILNRIREELRGEERKNNRMYADCYFCPIDEDGNKVPWPNSVAPRGFISWVDWDASKH
jgi:hypothetical protein